MIFLVCKNWRAIILTLVSLMFKFGLSVNQIKIERVNIESCYIFSSIIQFREVCGFFFEQLHSLSKVIPQRKINFKSTGQLIGRLLDNFRLIFFWGKPLGTFGIMDSVFRDIKFWDISFQTRSKSVGLPKKSLKTVHICNLRQFDQMILHSHCALACLAVFWLFVILFTMSNKKKLFFFFTCQNFTCKT